MIRLLAVLLLLGAGAVRATPIDVEGLNDPVFDAHARAVAKGLRCLVCQNQSIEDSDAPLAHDLRNLVRQRLAAGDSDDEACAYIVARYGDWVLLNPPFNARTAALWLAPGFVLLVGAAAIIMGRRRRHAAPPGLSPAEEERVARLLNDVNV